KQQGGLRLDVREQVLAGGDSGEPAVKAGDASASQLLARITSGDESIRMPPEGDRLSADDVAVLRQWISEGARWPDAANVVPSARGRTELKVTDADRQHWAFRGLRSPELPKTARQD